MLKIPLEILTLKTFEFFPSPIRCEFCGQPAVKTVTFGAITGHYITASVCAENMRNSRCQQRMFEQANKKNAYFLHETLF